MRSNRVFFSFAIILIAQHWSIAVIGIGAMVTIYMQARQDDSLLIERFGDAYEDYTQKAPRMNILLGLAHRRKRE
ncbi:MAG: hypothetical protein KAV48_00880 [Methanomicrobia archaeon]|nr:hypothetical protein [Methanomicrobia archaeon]